MLRITPLSFLQFLFSLSLVGSLNFTEEKSSHSGLVFVKITDAKISYDTYTMVYHIDLTHYYKINKMVQNYINIAEKDCSELNNSTCNVIIENIKSQMEFMYRDEIDINAYQQNQLYSGSINQTRQKRALEFIGSAFHWMFGLMDADTAREYDEKINDINNENERIKFVLKNHTVFIKETIGYLKNSFSDIDNQMTHINNKIKYLLSELKKWYETLNKIQIETEILKTGTVLQKLLTEHRTISTLLLKSLENAISGRINQLIPIKKLERDLFTIHQILPMSQMLPINFTTENPLSIFKYSKTTASLYGKRFLLEITIPIIERQQYATFEIIPVPIMVENKTIIINPLMRFVLINTGGSEYIPITKTELDNANTNFYGEKIITPSENSYLDISQSCEITIFLAPRKNTIMNLCEIRIIPTMNYFIPINHNNIFYITISKPITLIEHCFGKQIKSYDIHNSGKITLEPGCRISTDKLSIRPRTNYKYISGGEIILSNRTQSISLKAFSEKIAHLRNVPTPEFENDVVIKDHSTDFEKLASQAEKLIEQATWESNMEEIHYDNVNRSYFIYWIMGIAIIALIIGITIFGICIYLRFYNINTWIKLANVLGTNNSDRVPKLFIQNRPSAPHFNEL